MKKVRIFVTIDASGSMGVTKKYFSRCYYEKIKTILSLYFNVLDTVFIRHTITGEICDEESAFTEGASGGTYLSSGISQIYDLKLGDEDKILIMFSDGDNWGEDNERFGSMLNDLQNTFKHMFFVESRASTYESSVVRYIKENYKINNLQFKHFTNYTYSSIQGMELNDLISTLDKFNII